MSTLSVDTITGKSTSTNLTIGSTPVVSESANSLTIRGERSNQTSIQQGLAKVWSNHSMGSSNDSFNSSTITDNGGTGDFTLNFTNSFSSANHCATIGGSESNTNANVVVTVNQATGFAAGSVRHFTISEDTGILDLDAPTCHAIHGDLA